jgi:kinesin family member 6/9
MPRETDREEIILSGLSVHKAQTEEDALNLLFIGDTNRVVSETPKNDASTRSHCIFMITIEAKKAGSDVKTVSRLHLVDLSGSESET